MRTPRPADIGAAIRQRRRALGLGQQAVADLVGVSRQWIVEIEAGKPRAEIGLLLRTLAALDLAVEIVPEAGTAEEGRRSWASGPGRSAVDIDEIVAQARRLS